MDTHIIHLYTIKAMDTDELATQRVKPSTAMTLADFSRNILVAALDGLNFHVFVVYWYAFAQPHRPILHRTFLWPYWKVWIFTFFVLNNMHVPFCNQVATPLKYITFGKKAELIQIHMYHETSTFRNESKSRPDSWSAVDVTQSRYWFWPSSWQCQ